MSTHADLFSLSPIYTQRILYYHLDKSRLRRDFLNFLQHGNCNFKRYTYDEARTTTLAVLTAGNATTWTQIDLSALLPDTSETAHIHVHLPEKANADYAFVRPNGLNQTNGSFVTFFESSSTVDIYAPSQLIEYIAGATDHEVNIELLGYVEEL